MQHLNSQMIFFVDHHTVTFTFTDRDRARTISASQLAADQLAFHQQLAVQRSERFHVHMMHGTALDFRLQSRLDLLHNLKADVGSGARDKWKTGHIASQPDSAGNHNIRLRSIPAQPFATGASQLSQTEGFVLTI